MAWALDLISFLLPPDMKINTIFFTEEWASTHQILVLASSISITTIGCTRVDFFTKGVDKIRYVPVTIMTVCMQQQVWMI